MTASFPGSAGGKLDSTKEHVGFLCVNLNERIRVAGSPFRLSLLCLADGLRLGPIPGHVVVIERSALNQSTGLSHNSPPRLALSEPTWLGIVDSVLLG